MNPGQICRVRGLRGSTFLGGRRIELVLRATTAELKLLALGNQAVCFVKPIAERAETGLGTLKVDLLPPHESFLTSSGEINFIFDVSGIFFHLGTGFEDSTRTLFLLLLGTPLIGSDLNLF